MNELVYLENLRKKVSKPAKLSSGFQASEKEQNRCSSNTEIQTSSFEKMVNLLTKFEKNCILQKLLFVTRFRESNQRFGQKYNRHPKNENKPPKM